mgnify:CR=1 FL=1
MKHKIVYNNCYGGYTLSYKAIDWLSEHGSESTKNFIAQKRIEAKEKEDFSSASQERIDNVTNFYVMDAVGSYLDRHDPDLVAVVEALGKEASGTFSELAIAEIDEDKYFIDEYDGMEAVVTPADICWEVIDEYDDIVETVAPPVDVCCTGIE